MNMQTEPVRLPLWVASLLSAVVIPFAVALLTDVDLKQAAATALLAIVPLLGAGEVARHTAFSPDTHDRLVWQGTVFSNKPPDDDVPTTGAPEAGAADFVGVLVAIALIVAIAAGLRYLGVW